MFDLDAIKSTWGLKGDIRFTDVEPLVSKAKTKSFKANEVVISQGSKDRNIYFILKGLVRSYFIDSKGNDRTRGLLAENKIFTSTITIIKNKPAIYNIMALEPTDVLYMDVDELRDIIDSNPKLQKHKDSFYEHFIYKMDKQIHSFIFNSSEERYLDFIQSQPNIDQRVPNKYIASLLGITPVQLSRIRSRIASRK